MVASTFDGVSGISINSSNSSTNSTTAFLASNTLNWFFPAGGNLHLFFLTIRLQQDGLGIAEMLLIASCYC